MKTIKQLEKEIEELEDKANTLELDEEDRYSGDLVRIHTKLDKLNPLLEQTKAIKKMIVDKIDSLREKEQKYYDDKLKAFDEGSQFEGMYLGLAKETRKIIEVLEEILSKIEGGKK